MAEDDLVFSDFFQNVGNGEGAEIDSSNPPPLQVEVTHVNQHTHLDGIVSD